MNSAFLVSAGVAVSVTTADSIPRPRAALGPSFFVGQLGAQPSDIRMGWLPRYPDQIARLRPVHPDWTGVATGAVFVAAIAPVSWLPTVLQFLPAPRLHQVFGAYSFDPLSGEAMNAAILMAWDPRQKPIVTRPKLHAESVFYAIPPSVAATGASCVDMIDDSFGVPLLATEVLARPDGLEAVFGCPAFINEDLC